MKRAASIAAFLFAAATAASAQIAETMEVRVTNVDVVVTDRSGKVVTGLTKDDFQILENGFEQSITNFYEVREEAAKSQAPVIEGPSLPEDFPTEQRRRRVVIFVDQSSVDPRRRASAIAAADRALDRLMRPDDEAMVVSFLRDRRVLASLTPDREAVRRALSEVGNQSVLSSLRRAERDQVLINAKDLIQFSRDYPRLLPMPTAYAYASAAASALADELYNQQKRLVAACRQVLASMVGLDGRKVLIFIGGDLQSRPGVDVFEAVDALFRGERNVMVLGGANMREGSKRNLAGELEKLSREANANGVTVYLIDAMDRGGSKSASEAAAIDRRGVAFAAADTDFDSALSMTNLAAETGGKALVNSINFDLAMENIVRDLGSYYSLGYRPPSGMGDRTIKVKVRKPGLTARSRQSYTLRSSDQELEDRVTANALHPRMSSDLPVSVEVGKAEPDGKLFRVPVTIRLPGDVTTIASGGSESGELAFYFVTASVDGQVSPVAKDVRPFAYSGSAAGVIRGQPITYNGSLRVRAGEQFVSVAVVDRLAGRSGFARTKFRAP